MTHNKVIWSEGMFLKPQHFQQQDRYWHQQQRSVLDLLSTENWGVSHLLLNNDSLKLGKIAVTECAGIFPDGTAFNAPYIDGTPTPLELSEGLNDTIVYLGIRETKPGYPEATLEEDNFAYRYYNNSIEVTDAIADSQQMAGLNVARLSMCLLLDRDDRSNHSCIPIARIKEVRSNKHIILDPKFIPTCIDIHATEHLIGFISEVHNLLQHRAETLSYRLTDINQSGTSEVVDFMLLQLVNRFSPVFEHLHHKKVIHPEELYAYLLQLLGEISTYTNDKRRPPPLKQYLHHDLTATFDDICTHLRAALSMVLEQNAVAINLTEHDYGVWIAQIEDKELLHTAEFIIAIYADIPVEHLRNSFPNQVKIAPAEQLQVLVSRALPGIRLKVLPIAPRQIPYHANFAYFSLDKTSELWQELSQSAGIAFHIGNHFAGLKLELWAIKG